MWGVLSRCSGSGSDKTPIGKPYRFHERMAARRQETTPCPLPPAPTVVSASTAAASSADRSLRTWVAIVSYASARVARLSLRLRRCGRAGCVRGCGARVWWARFGIRPGSRAGGCGLTGLGCCLRWRASGGRGSRGAPAGWPLGGSVAVERVRLPGSGARMQVCARAARRVGSGRLR
jgi:hypothetical protein